jgi:uncharacterized protein YaeQ
LARQSDAEIPGAPANVILHGHADGPATGDFPACERSEPLMALPATRYEYRIALSHVDRGREVTEAVVVARHPSETAEHLTLRVLAHCLLNEEGLAFGPGLSDPDAADLWTKDLTGRLVTWIECGAAAADKVRKVLLHNSGIAAHVVLADAKRVADLAVELPAAGRLPRKGPAPILWAIDPALVKALAAKEERRQKWTVTVVGDHLYVDADGDSVDGAAVPTIVAPEA